MNNEVIITNERALVVKSTEVLALLNFYLRHTEFSCRPDKYATKREGKAKYKWIPYTVTYYIDEEGSPFYVIPRGIAELLPDDEFNKIHETTNIIKIPEDLDDEYIRNILGHDYILRDDQVDAVNKSLYYKRGINQLATGSGKSIIICAIMKILIENNPNCKLLIVLPYDHLQISFADYFDLFGIKYDYANSQKEDANVTISSAVSFLNREFLFPKYHGVFYDECQHLSSDTWQAVSMTLSSAEIALGFSAKVIDPKNIVNPDIRKISTSEAYAIGATGKVITYVPPAYYIAKGILATPVLITVNTNLSEELLEESSWRKSVDEGVMSPERTDTIARVVDIFSSHDRRVLVLASTHEQSFRVAKAILGYAPGITVGITHGGNRGYFYSMRGNDLVTENVQGRDVIHSFKDGTINILIGTSHMDEGADLPNLDVCVLAGTGKKSRRIIQRVGRSLRISKTGKYAYLIDFVDENSKILNKHYKERMRTYVSDIGISADRSYKEVDVAQIEDIFKSLEEGHED